MGELSGVRIGLAMAASHCNLSRAVDTISLLVSEGAEVTPIVSPSIFRVETRFGTPDFWREQIRRTANHDILETIPEVEPTGPKHWFDVVAVVPCTGNTLSKLANAINDSPVTMAVKAHLRNERPVVLAITSNDLLGLNAANLGRLMAARNIFFVPYGQDDPIKKPRSLDAHLERIVPTIQEALQGRQVQPILVPWT